MSDVLPDSGPLNAKSQFASCCFVLGTSVCSDDSAAVLIALFNG